MPSAAPGKPAPEVASGTPWQTLDPTALTKVDTNAVETTAPAALGDGWYKYTFDASTQMAALADLLRYEGHAVGIDFDQNKTLEWKVETRNPNDGHLTVGLEISTSAFAEGQLTQSFENSATQANDKHTHKLRELASGFATSTTGGTDTGGNQVYCGRSQVIADSAKFETMAHAFEADDYTSTVNGKDSDTIADAAFGAGVAMQIGIALGVLTNQRSDAEIEARIRFRVTDWS